MAKVKIELDLDWIRDEETIDEVIKEEVIIGLQDKLVSNIEEKVSDKLNEKLREIADKVTNSFIEETLKTKIENLKIPRKKSSWDTEIEYVPISEFIGDKYEQYVNKKVFDEYGERAEWGRKAKYSLAEYLTQNYLEKELTDKVSAMIQKAREQAENTIISTLENNLKEQLSIDIIRRLNVPQMLKALQTKAVELNAGEGVNGND
jgi:hypothetical protein